MGREALREDKANTERNVVQDLNSIVKLSSICFHFHSLFPSVLPDIWSKVYLLFVVPFTEHSPAYIQLCVSKTIKMSKHAPWCP